MQALVLLISTLTLVASQNICSRSNCNTTSDCAAGVCCNSICYEPPKAGEPCTPCFQCDGEATCDNGLCKFSTPDCGCSPTRICPNSYVCLSNGTCARMRERQPGQSCEYEVQCANDAMECVGGICQGPLNVNDSCGITDQCRIGLSCINSRCLPRLSNGENCGTSANCLSGSCYQGRCSIKGPLGSNCSVSENCEAGLVCNTQTCVGIYSLPVGSLCSSDIACNSALCSCDFSTGSCIAKCIAVNSVPNGGYCFPFTNTVCQSGLCLPLNFSVGICTEMLSVANGGLCAQDAQCASGNCNTRKNSCAPYFSEPVGGDCGDTSDCVGNATCRNFKCVATNGSTCRFTDVDCGGAESCVCSNGTSTCEINPVQEQEIQNATLVYSQCQIPFKNLNKGFSISACARDETFCNRLLADLYCCLKCVVGLNPVATGISVNCATRDLVPRTECCGSDQPCFTVTGCSAYSPTDTFVNPTGSTQPSGTVPSGTEPSTSLPSSTTSDESAASMIPIGCMLCAFLFFMLQ